MYVNNIHNVKQTYKKPQMYTIKFPVVFGKRVFQPPCPPLPLYPAWVRASPSKICTYEYDTSYHVSVTSRGHLLITWI